METFDDSIALIFDRCAQSVYEQQAGFQPDSRRATTESSFLAAVGVRPHVVGNDCLVKTTAF